MTPAENEFIERQFEHLFQTDDCTLCEWAHPARKEPPMAATAQPKDDSDGLDILVSRVRRTAP